MADRLPADSGPVQVLNVLKDCARRREACPTDYALSLRLGVAPATVVGWVATLKKNGVITIRAVMVQVRRNVTEPYRIVTITENNQQTAGPPNALAKRVVPVPDTVDLAQTHLRRLGYLVFKSSVLNPGSLLYFMDRKQLTKRELIGEAQRRGFKIPKAGG